METKSFMICVIIAFSFWQYAHPIVGVGVEKYSDVSDPIIKNSSVLMLNCTNDDSSNPHIEATDSNFNHSIFEKQNATLNCSITTSISMRIRLLDWEIPENAGRKIIKGDCIEIRHEQSITFFQILSIYNVTKDDQRDYVCKVIEDDCNTKIITHSLHVEGLDLVFLNITALEKSNSITVKAEEGPVKFIATIEAFPNHTTFTWEDPYGIQIEASRLEEPMRRIISDGHKIELEIKKVTIDNFGIYQLKVSNSLLTKTLDFNLIVEDKPSDIYMIEAATLFIPNDIHSRVCIVTGYPLPQITWSGMFCDEYPSCKDNIFQHISKSQHREDAIKPYAVMSTVYLNSSRSMLIRCEAKNSLGYSDRSSAYLLTDYGNGVVMRRNYSGIITVGDNIRLFCAASKYRYMDKFSWMFEETKLIPSHDIQIENSATNFSYISTLSISNIQKNQSGRYVCRTLFSAPSSKSKHLGDFGRSELIIEDVEKPSIHQSNMRGGVLHLAPGKSINILIHVGGCPLPTVVWYKDGNPLTLNDRVMNISQNLTYQHLSIVNVSRDDEGVYSFVATNKAGNVSDHLEFFIQHSIRNRKEKNVHNSSTTSTAFCIFVSFLLIGIVLRFLRNLRKKNKKLQKVIEECELEDRRESTGSNLDPNFEVGEQSPSIQFDKFEFAKEKLEFCEVLGSGEFGIVKKAIAHGIIKKGVQTTVAVKLAKEDDDLSVKALVSELKIMIYLGQHPNVLNLLGACTKNLIEGELAIIVEYCEYGNLRNFLLDQRPTFVNQINENDEITVDHCYENIRSHQETDFEGTSENISNEETRIGQGTSITSISPIKTQDLIRWAMDIATGMEYLASRNILHGDLAARNVLLTREVAKVSDFGYSKNIYEGEHYKSRKTVFPVKWMAIESIKDQLFSTQSDIWSFGITMWEIFSLSISPYPGLKHENLLEKLLTGYRLQKPEFATDEIYSLMKECWHEDPKCRPTFMRLSEELKRINDSTINASVEGVKLYQENPMYIEMTKTPNSFCE